MSRLENFSTHRPREKRDDVAEVVQKPKRKIPSSYVIVEEGMSIDKALSLFKQGCQKSGLNAELRKRQFHVKPSEKRREQERSRKKAIEKYKSKERQRDQEG